MNASNCFVVALFAIGCATCTASSEARAPLVTKDAKDTKDTKKASDKACRKDNDCVWVTDPHSPCICLPCQGLALNHPGEKARVKKLNAIDCEAPATCKPCPNRRPGTKAICRQGQCEVLLGPPIQPSDKNRDCKKNGDCAFVPPSGCGCGPCGDQWQRSANKKHVEWLNGEYAKESCPRHKCAKCSKPLRWLGTQASCVKGQCTTR